MSLSPQEIKQAFDDMQDTRKRMVKTKHSYKLSLLPRLCKTCNHIIWFRKGYKIITVDHFIKSIGWKCTGCFTFDTLKGK